jgi:hypothetical protein
MSQVPISGAQKAEDQTQKSDNQKGLCIACRNELAVGATLCDKCKSYQAAWKNTLLYSAQLIGLVALFFSALVYIFSSFEDVRKTLWWEDDLEILSFASESYVTLANIGDGEVFLSHIEYTIKQGSKGGVGTVNLGKTIKPAEALQHSISPFGQNQDFRFFGTSNDENWERTARRAFTGNDPCISHSVFYEKDPTVLALKMAYKDKFRALSATAKLYFYSLAKRKMLSKEISVIGVVLVREKCAEKEGEQLPRLPPGTARGPVS